MLKDQKTIKFRNYKAPKYIKIYNFQGKKTQYE